MKQITRWLCRHIFTDSEREYVFELIARDMLLRDARNPIAVSVCGKLDTAPVKLGTLYELHKFNLKHPPL